MGLISRLLGREQSARLPNDVVTFDDKCVTRVLRDGTQETIGWDELPLGQNSCRFDRILN